MSERQTSHSDDSTHVNLQNEGTLENKRISGITVQIIGRSKKALSRLSKRYSFPTINSKKETLDNSPEPAGSPPKDLENNNGNGEKFHLCDFMNCCANYHNASLFSNEADLRDTVKKSSL